MKPGLAASAALHAALLTWGLWSLSSPKALDVSYAEALPVEIVMSDRFEGVKGDKKAPAKEKPALTPTKTPAKLPMPAENIGENEIDLDTPPVPDAKPTKVEVKQAASRSEPPPSPKPPEPVKPEPAKAEPPKPEPPKPEPKVAETPAPTPPTPTPPKPAPPKVAPEPDPVEQAIADAAALPDPAPKAEPTPPKVPVPQVKPAPPKPEVAEKPAEDKPKAADQKPAKTESKPEKSKDTKVADRHVDAPEKSEFNADDIASLLSKQKAAGGGAKRSTEQASLGSTKTTGTKLSRSQEGELQGLIKEQMAKCWSPPTGLEDAGSLRVLIKIRFDPSGQIDGTPELVSGGGGSGPQRAAAEAAMRAIRRCAPFNLPVEMYAGGWDVTNLDFDPSEMF